MPVCRVRGVNLNYLSTGSRVGKKRSIIFVHGAAGNGRRWQNQLEALRDDYYAVALDLPGHGQSEGNACDAVFLYREWVKEFMDALGLDASIIAGHSMGGAIALDLFQRYPGKVSGLILVGTTVHFNIDPFRLETLSRGEKYRPEWVRITFSPFAPADLVEKVNKEIQEVDPRVYHADLTACDRFETNALAKINVPTLIICGADDVTTPPESSRYMAERITGSSLLFVEKAAHNVMLEQPQAVNTAIAEFLERI